MIRRIIAKESGSAAIEFAIVAPLLIYLLLGVIDVGRYMFDGIVAEHAARSAVQYGAQTAYTAEDTAGITTAAARDGQSLSQLHVKSAINCAINGATVQCPVDTSFIPGNLAYYVQVQVTAVFQPLVNYPGIPSTLQVTSIATMRLGTQ